MPPEDGPAGSLESFAQSNGLVFSDAPSLPQEGTLLSAGGDVKGAASGKLPGGLDGTLAYYTYTTTTTDSDGHSTTHHHHNTVVVGRVPESIGFAPYLAFRGPSVTTGLGLHGDTKQVEAVGEAVKGARAFAFDGTSDAWLTQLFSPALIDWLGRSPDDFGFELSGGALCVARSDYVGGGDLTSLCNDAAHVAAAIATECQEAVDSGLAASQGAHSKPPDPGLERRSTTSPARERPTTSERRPVPSAATSSPRPARTSRRFFGDSWSPPSSTCSCWRSRST